MDDEKPRKFPKKANPPPDEELKPAGPVETFPKGEKPKLYDDPPGEIPGHALNDGAPLHPHNQGEVVRLTNTEPDVKERAALGRKLDPELKAMDEVCEIMERLDPAARERVVNWCAAKFDMEMLGIDPTPDYRTEDEE